MSSEDEEYENEEGEEEEGNEEHEEHEEDEEKEVRKPKKRKFEEILPAKSDTVSEVALLLPGKGKEKQNVKLRTLPGRKSFERTYRAHLKKLRRENIMQQLENDPEGKKLFLEMEQDHEEEEEEEVDDEDEDDEEDGPKLPTPFWLPYLFSNDTFYLDRVLSTMYGYAVSPPDPKKPEDDQDGEADDLELEGQEQGSGGDEEAVEGEEREEDERRSRKTKSEPEPTPEASEEGGNIPAETEQGEEQSPRVPEVPPLVIPAFAHPNYKFFIVFEKNSEEWHLLDLHPTIWTFRYHAAIANKKKAAEESRQEREETGERKNEDEEGDEEGDEEENEEDEESEEKKDNDEEEDEEEEDFDYDLKTMICIDALMLAALQSPVALRYILLQPKAASLELVQEWIKKEPTVGFAYLAAIQSALNMIQRNDAARLPYRCARLFIDFNIFFEPAYLYSKKPPKFSNCGLDNIDADETKIASFRSVDAQSTIQVLLAVGIAPSVPIELKHFSTVEGIQLGLWLMLVMPKSIFLEWSEASTAEVVEENPAEDADEEEEEEEEEGEGSVTESILRRRIQKEEKKKLKANPPEEKVPFLPAPFLSKLILELRRRSKRARNGKGLSKFPLELCLERVWKPEKLENGKRDGDPLVTSSFSIDAVERKPGPLPLVRDLDEIMSHSVVRHQKLYQSDLILFLLAMTWPQPLRSANSATSRPSTATEHHGTVVVRRMSGETSSTTTKSKTIFADVLNAKMNLMTSPLHKARSGTLRFLYLEMHRFKSPEAAQLLTEVSPLYQLFGVNERCPLPELIGSWMLEQRPQKLAHFEIFVNMFWHELYYRVECRLYEPNVVEFLNNYCPNLLLMVNERYTQYTGVIDILGGLLHRHSALHHTTFRRIRNMASSSMGVQEKYDADEFNANPFREQVMVSLLNPSPYNTEYIREERRVVAAFESLPMPPRTYYTPETLYQLLFTVEQVDFVAIRYLMVVVGITTVRENPFSKKEVDALEYAITTQNHHITNLIIGLGFSIDGTIDEGRMAIDFYAENKFDVKDTLHMKEVWSENATTISSDPTRQYGILRGDAANSKNATNRSR